MMIVHASAYQHPILVRNPDVDDLPMAFLIHFTEAVQLSEVVDHQIVHDDDACGGIHPDQFYAGMMPLQASSRHVFDDGTGRFMMLPVMRYARVARAFEVTLQIAFRLGNRGADVGRSGYVDARTHFE